MKIVVTGGSGNAGRAVVRDLLDHGYQVLNADLVPSPDPVAPFLRADLTDLGQTIDVLKGADAAVHLAAIPAPQFWTDGDTFRINMMSTYNVFSAAVTLRLTRVVWASSETTLGLPFDRQKPLYVPIDEEHPLFPESTYALSKVLSEEMARHFNRWSDIPFIGLRFSNIMQRQHYAQFPGYWEDPNRRKWNLWGYVDSSHVSQSCRLALETNIKGAESFIIAAADTVMSRPSRELMAEVFPGVPIREGLGAYDTLLGIDKARRLLGYNPEFSWRSLNLA
jgi:nucleoside-diphosphate-sugar epimerase